MKHHFIKNFAQKGSTGPANLFRCVFGKQALVLNYFACRIKLEILEHIVQILFRKRFECSSCSWI